MYVHWHICIYTYPVLYPATSLIGSSNSAKPSGHARSWPNSQAIGQEHWWRSWVLKFSQAVWPNPEGMSRVSCSATLAGQQVADRNRWSDKVLNHILCLDILFWPRPWQLMVSAKYILYDIINKYRSIYNILYNSYYNIMFCQASTPTHIHTINSNAVKLQ